LVEFSLATSERVADKKTEEEEKERIAVKPKSADDYVERPRYLRMRRISGKASTYET